MADHSSPLVSIIMPLFNRPKLVVETIGSVLAQSCSSWELLVVDDHSTDDSLDRARQSAGGDPRIRLWRRTAAQRGAPACRNEGWQQARGEYVVFLDSDDLLAPHCLEQRVRTARQHPQHQVWAFPGQSFRARPGDLTQVNFHPCDDLLAGFLSRPLWITTSTIWTLESIRQLEGFREDLMAWQDWDLHLRALVAGLSIGLYPGPPDWFLRRASHSRISMGISRRLEQFDNRAMLFADTIRSLDQHQQWNEQRRENFRDLCLRLAADMVRAGAREQADRWVERLSELQLIAVDQVDDCRQQAHQQGERTAQDRIRDTKTWILELVNRFRV